MSVFSHFWRILGHFQVFSGFSVYILRFRVNLIVFCIFRSLLGIFGFRSQFLRFLGLESILSVFSHFGPYFSRKNIKVVGQNWFGIFSAFYVSFKVLGLDWADFCPIWRFFWSMSHLDKFLPPIRTLKPMSHLGSHLDQENPCHI